LRAHGHDRGAIVSAIDRSWMARRSSIDNAMDAAACCMRQLPAAIAYGLGGAAFRGRDIFILFFF
jgi:hypothetical protein